MQEGRFLIARVEISSRHRFRLLGLLPFTFFLAQAVHYWKLPDGELGHMLWMCNIGNLILGLGLIIERASLIRVAALWMIPGLVVWFIYVVAAWGVFFSSTLAHVGGFIVGMIALRRVGMDQLSWLYAFLWYLAMQLLSKLFTRADLNVNVAHSIDPAWRDTFASYWKFWLVLSLGVAAVLWLLSLLLRLAWPDWKVVAGRSPGTGEMASEAKGAIRGA